MNRYVYDDRHYTSRIHKKRNLNKKIDDIEEKIKEVKRNHIIDKLSCIGFTGTFSSGYIYLANSDSHILSNSPLAQVSLYLFGAMSAAVGIMGTKQINDSYYPKLAKIICDRDELLDEKDNLDSRI
tara:strand:+ start:1316 stop:1693 length:378 start_codon:yes stop_codon:yes gene_type:complete